MGRKTHFRARAPSAAILPGAEAFARYRPIVDDWEAFRRALEAPLPTVIWTNTLKADPERLADILRADGIPLEPLSWRPGAFKLLVQDAKPGNHWGFLGGLCHVQEEVSLLPVLLLDPRPGERVLDLCAAPGNKTVQIAVAMANRGTVVANDRDYHRIRAIHHMTERLGILNTSMTLYDGANYPKAAGLFDRILVDVPCSCEGTVRKSPELAIDPTGGLSRKMSGGQQALLRKAIQLCRPGGRIVYASCTYAPEENEAVIDALLREAGPQVVRLVPARVEGFHSSEGLTAWDGATYDESLRLAMRVWPHQNDTGGFFVAVLEKAREASPSARDRGLPSPCGGTDPCGPCAPSNRNPPDDSRALAACLEILEQRFGMAPDGFADYTFFRRTPRELRIVNRDHQTPLQPEPQSTGMVFMRAETRFPKLTTAAAMLFGTRAVRNTVDLDEGQMQAYVQRRDILLRGDQVGSCTGIGYVLVRYQGLPFGIALYLPDEQDKGDRLKSMFPKAWALR
jgi:NOL1/NOP2/sun family putative RNA methylase